VLGAHRLK